MAEVIYSAEALADLERIIDFLLETSPDTAGDALAQIRSAVAILASHPHIGRRVDRHWRELVITYGVSGYLALYRFDAKANVARVLRVRHQREAGHSD